MKSHHVDDIRKVVTLFNNLRWDEVSKAFKTIENDDMVLDENIKYCANEIRKAMETINPDLKFTLELEQDLSNKKLPTLDLSMWLKDNGPQSSPNIEFEFFSKEMSSIYCILEKSSMDYSSKVSILINDLCRRLLNTRESIAQSRKDQIVDEYALKMLRSGYSLTQVRFIIVSGIRSFKRKVSHAKESGTKLQSLL